jgi:hypothetical protein
MRSLTRSFNGKWKQREFGKLKGRDVERLDTLEKDGKLYYRLNELRNTRLRASIIQNTLVNIGVIRCITRVIHLMLTENDFDLER